MVFSGYADHDYIPRAIRRQRQMVIRDRPETYLVIGETGDGDYYCLDTSGEQPGVLQFLNQPAEFECVTESLEEFVEMLVLAFTEEDNGCLSDEDDADDEEDLLDEEDDDESAG